MDEKAVKCPVANVEKSTHGLAGVLFHPLLGVGCNIQCSQDVQAFLFPPESVQRQLKRGRLLEGPYVIRRDVGEYPAPPGKSTARQILRFMEDRPALRCQQLQRRRSFRTIKPA